MKTRLEAAAENILVWYDDERESNPHSAEEWQKAYQELRDALTECWFNHGWRNKQQSECNHAYVIDGNKSTTRMTCCKCNHETDLKI